MLSKLLSKKWGVRRLNTKFLEKCINKSCNFKCHYHILFRTNYRPSSEITYSTQIRQEIVDTPIQSNELENAKPFSEIPGPKSFPLIGNWWRFALPFGDYYKMDAYQMVQRLHEEYGDVVFLKGMGTNRSMLYISNPTDIEKMHRNEGVWPITYLIPSVVYYRTFMERNVRYSSGGLVALQGEEWSKFRSIVNPIFLKPKNVQQYIGQMDAIVNDLLDNIATYADESPSNEMPEYFINDLYKWALDSVGTIAADSQFRCLKRDSARNSDPWILITNILEMLDLVYKLDVLPSYWRYFTTPNWRRFITVMDTVTRVAYKFVERGLEKPLPENGHLTSIQQLSQKEERMAYAMALDLIVGGVDTTGRTLGAALYFLAKNPSKYNELQREASALLPKKDSSVTAEILSSAPYLRAVIKETMRIARIGIGNFRAMPKDIVLGGYVIPKGTHISTSNLILCLSDKYFPNAKEFRPERWLKSHPQANKGIHPFVYLPFGYGPRACIGQRIAHMELEIAILKIARNFNLAWKHEDMKFKTKLLHGIADPLRLTVNHIEK